MKEATREAYYEIDSILNFLNKTYVNAIPQKLRKKFKENKAENYNKKIVPYKKLNEQDLKDEKLVLFTGTPCQTAGLSTYLSKDYPNLILCDII